MEKGNSNRNNMTWEAKKTHYLALYRKSLPPPPVNTIILPSQYLLRLPQSSGN